MKKTLTTILTLEEANFIKLEDDWHVAHWNSKFDKVVKHDVKKLQRLKNC